MEYRAWRADAAELRLTDKSSRYPRDGSESATERGERLQVRHPPAVVAHSWSDWFGPRGFDLDLTLNESEPASHTVDGSVGERLAQHRRRVREIASRHGLPNVRVFGSVARCDDTVDSDVDLLVDVAPGVGLIGLAAPSGTSSPC